MRVAMLGGGIEPLTGGACGNDVDETGRDTRFFEELGDAAPWCFGRRLDDARIAGGRRGATLRVIIAAGKFHGVTITTTPTGGWCTMILLLPPGAVLIMPSMRTASSLFQRKNSAA